MVDRNLIKIFRNIAILLRIKGDNPFKADAYEKAADIIESQQLDILNLARNNQLPEIKGIGDALAKKIYEYVQTGKLEYYEKLKTEIPLELISLTRLSNLGPKKTKLLYDKLGIKNIDDLEKACLENKVANLKGFSEKSQEIILNSIQHYRAWKGKVQQFACLDKVKEIEAILSDIHEITAFSVTGEIRRVEEIITKISFIVSTSSPETLKRKLSYRFQSNWVGNKLEISTEEEVPIEFEITTADFFVWRLHNSTGSNEYLEAFAHLFTKFTSEVFDTYVPPKSFTHLSNEEQLFDKLNLQYIPPELRENSRILEISKNKAIPKLIEEKDLRGMIHIHTNWSDGHSSLEEMVDATKGLGFEYVVICDHSQTAKYANGLEPERLLHQIDYIDKLNEIGLGIKILKGIESDILPDGSLDYPEEILKRLDVVVASVHSHFKMTKEQMTKRIIYALRSPYTSILGHPTGRLLLARRSYEVDIREIINVAADYGKIIEFNANPYRLDLPWEYLEYAKEKGVMISLNPDSHDKFSLNDIFYGLKFLRKGQIEAKDVINSLSYQEFLKLIRDIKSRNRYP
ncbi:MAG: DNA polymerase/3'-5' exonuclease PolX [Candidatus Kapaibacteriales bacterium]